MSKTIFNVYGETRNGWTISPTKDERTLSVNKRYKIRTREGKILDKAISLGVQREVLGNNLELFSGLISKNRGRVYNFFGKNINIKYSKRAMAPYAIKPNSRTRKRDLVTFLTFDIKDKTLVDFSIGDRGCVLEMAFDNINKELSIITMMDTKESNYIKLLFKTNKGKFIQYRFIQKDMYGNLELNTEVIPRHEVKPEILTQKSFELIKFRPMFPTSIVLCEVGKYDEVLELMADKFNNNDCEIHEYINDELPYIYNELKAKGQKAITVYYTEYSEDPKEIDDVSKQFITFKIINRLTNNGKIVYIKK